MLTQKEQILAHLRSYNPATGEYRTLSQMEALGLYRIPRLASRIDELRQDGNSIESLRKKDPTGRPYVRYRLVFNRPISRTTRRR